MIFLRLLLIFILNQPACFAYSPSVFPFYNQRMYRRGVMTGIPAPIFQYNVPNAPDNLYMKKKNLRKRNNVQYPSAQPVQTFTIIDQY